MISGKVKMTGTVSADISDNAVLNATVNPVGIISGTIQNQNTISGFINESSNISGEVNSEKQMTASVFIFEGMHPKKYDGEYEFTPSAEEQTVNTEHEYLSRNIIINPIPNNYGLITWDGSTLTVS